VLAGAAAFVLVGRFAAAGTGVEARLLTWLEGRLAAPDKRCLVPSFTFSATRLDFCVIFFISAYGA
jgi:hypothetical protein